MSTLIQRAVSTFGTLHSCHDEQEKNGGISTRTLPRRGEIICVKNMMKNIINSSRMCSDVSSVFLTQHTKNNLNLLRDITLWSICDRIRGSQKISSCCAHGAEHEPTTFKWYSFKRTIRHFGKARFPVERVEHSCHIICSMSLWQSCGDNTTVAFFLWYSSLIAFNFATVVTTSTGQRQI